MVEEVERNKENIIMDDHEEDEKIWQLEDFEIGDCLGNGKFGYVYKGVEKSSKKDVAIKVISKKIVAQFEFFEQLKNEIEIHTRLIHKNIVRMYGYFYDNSYVYLIYDYIHRGNLFNYIKSVGKLSEVEAARFTYDIAKALNYLKKRNILHRDLKLENVMIEEDEITKLPYLKLADFGWACQYFSDKRMTLCGTPECKYFYFLFSFSLDLAPEMANSQAYDFQVDVWSLGIMTYEMVTGYSPFCGTESEILNKIKNYEGYYSIKDKLEKVEASIELCDFINKILISDYNKRIQIEDLMIHPWIKNNLLL